MKIILNSMTHEFTLILLKAMNGQPILQPKGMNFKLKKILCTDLSTHYTGVSRHPGLVYVVVELHKKNYFKV